MWFLFLNFPWADPIKLITWAYLWTIGVLKCPDLEIFTCRYITRDIHMSLYITRDIHMYLLANKMKFLGFYADCECCNGQTPLIGEFLKLIWIICLLA